MEKYVVIMAGGVGSRFWPASTEERPKQFLDILGIGKSLLRMTFERCLLFVEADHIIIVTNKNYYPLVKNELPELADENILCEPSRNNTAPCIAYAALHIRSRHENAVFAVLPSDHVIMYEKKFGACMDQAFTFAAKNDAILTLGIQPTRPDTGYGYIQLDEGENDFRKVISFREKPDLEQAKKYIDQGNFVWNAGIFIWSIKTLLAAFEKYAPDIIDLLSTETDKFNTSLEQSYIDEVYPQTQKISIDYAILEKAKNVFTLPVDIGWSDLGTWNSLYEYSEKDVDNNVIQAKEQIIDDVTHCFIRTQAGKKILVRGLKNFIVVDEANALLIYPMEHEQDIKKALNA